MFSSIIWGKARLAGNRSSMEFLRISSPVSSNRASGRVHHLCSFPSYIPASSGILHVNVELRSLEWPSTTPWVSIPHRRQRTAVRWILPFGSCFQGKRSLSNWTSLALPKVGYPKETMGCHHWSLDIPWKTATLGYTKRLDKAKQELNILPESFAFPKGS